MGDNEDEEKKTSDRRKCYTQKENIKSDLAGLTPSNELEKLIMIYGTDRLIYGIVVYEKRCGQF